MTKKDEGFIVVRKYMMKSMKLHGIPLLVYARIHGFTVNDGAGCYETNASLARNLDVTPRAIANAIKYLKSRGLIIEVGKHRLKNGRITKVYKTVLPYEKSSETDCPTGKDFYEENSDVDPSTGEQSSDSDMKKVPPNKKPANKSKESKGGDRFDEYNF